MGKRTSTYCLGLVGVICARLAIFGATFGDALAAASLLGFVGFAHWIESRKQEPINDSVREEIAEIKNKVTAIQLGRLR